MTGTTGPEAAKPTGLKNIGLIVLALAFAGLVVVVASIIPTAMGAHQVMCDGVAEMWMIPEDYDGGGCIALPPWWEHLVPGHDTRRVCLSMCLQDIKPLQSVGPGAMAH